VRSSPARGKWAEDRAAAYLTESLGYRLQARNVRLGGGEIDLVLRDGDVQVFVEVKARRGGAAQAVAAVSADKRRRLGRAAALWLARRGLPSGGCRFDVVAIGGPGPGDEVQHFRDAFEAPQRWGI